jgi:PAS domain-containing protein
MKLMGSLDLGLNFCSQDMARKCTLPAIVLLTALGIGVSILCLSFGITIVFQNLFYLPIILVCAYYSRFGMLYTTILCLIYLALVVFIADSPSLIPLAVIRIAFFEIIAAAIVILSIERNKAEQTIQFQKANLSSLVAEQTDALNRELAQSQRQEKAYRESTEFLERCCGQINVAIIQWNSDRYITKINLAFERLLRKSSSELIGRRLSSIPWLEEAGRYTIGHSFEVTFPIDGRDYRSALWSITEIVQKDANRSQIYIAAGIEIPSIRKPLNQEDTKDSIHGKPGE